MLQSKTLHLISGLKNCVGTILAEYLCFANFVNAINCKAKVHNLLIDPGGILT